MDLQSPWQFLIIGYLATVMLETPVLLIGLSQGNTMRTRLVAAAWLTACTYPVVVLVLPPLLRESWGETVYLLVAETFAPLAECVLFTLVFNTKEERWSKTNVQDCLIITGANLFSFLTGQAYWWWHGALLLERSPEFF
jgi:hypothetical protein